jgi:hypothetical protein
VVDSTFLPALLGVTSLVTPVIALVLAFQVITRRTLLSEDESDFLSIAVLIGSLAFYVPKLAGIDLSDPLVMVPVTLSLAGIAFRNRYLASGISLLVAIGVFFSGLLEAADVWQYLVDPLIVIFAIYTLWRHRQRITDLRIGDSGWQHSALIIISVFLAWAVYLASADPDGFRNRLVVEDGFVEWVTVVILFVTMIVCARRFIVLRSHRPPLFLAVTALLSLLCLFGAGEEISWGQRIFDLETPEYFEEKNAQGEIGFHNLVVEINGEPVKLNKLIFGTGLAIALLIYLFIVTPLYRTKLPVKRFFNALAAPMPRNYQIAGYLVIVAVVELLIDHSKRGEMTEFAGSIMFALNVIFPSNGELFNKSKTIHELGGDNS